jgi:thioredoxin reductase (NADPH)
VKEKPLMTKPLGVLVDVERAEIRQPSAQRIPDVSYAPILTAPQIERIRVFAKPREVTAGEILYQPNDDTPPVFVVLSGGMKILAVGGVEVRTVTTYGAGQFSGELLMISGRKSIYR